MIGLTLFYTATHYTGLTFRSKRQLGKYLDQIAERPVTEWLEIAIYPIRKAKVTPVNLVTSSWH